ncbi:hypothetical protein D046_2095C, partial [Vibrio parahaemolyticus V-223/04]
KHGSCLVSL